MARFKIPQLPANCFGLAIPHKTKCHDPSILCDGDDYNPQTGEVTTEKVLWFRGRKVKAEKQVETSEIAEEMDTCWLDNAGQPGSAERIAALAEHYAKGGETSPFVASDSECADELINQFVRGELSRNLTSGKEIGEIIRKVATEVMG